MAEVTPGTSYQGLDVQKIVLDDDDFAVVHFASRRLATVSWGEGGVSWSVVPADAAEEDFSTVVEYSLVSEGDDDWVPEPEGPFTERSIGNIWGRIERVRFTNTGDAARVIVSSPSKVTVDG